MWPLVRGLDLAWQLPDTEPRRRPIVTFDEPGFPTVDAVALPAMPGARSATSVAELVDALQPDAVLLWRHGSTFPAEAWKAIFSFLDNGGNLLYAGGEPWTRPVTGAAGSRRLEPRTVSQLQALRLNQSYRVRLGTATLQRVAGANPGSRPLASDTWIAALEPRFTDTQDFPTEAGSPGARDALLRPLAYAMASDGDPRFPLRPLPTRSIACAARLPEAAGCSGSRRRRRKTTSGTGSSMKRRTARWTFVSDRHSAAFMKASSRP